MKKLFPTDHNAGSNNLSSRRETNLNDASNKRFYKPLNIPVTIPKIIDSSSINSPRNSFFGSQIEAIMFAFGECRYVTSDVLQLMEETVRQFNLFLINRILERKRVEESRQEIQLNLSDIVGLIQKDNRLTRRTCAFVKSIGASLDEKHNWKDYSDDNYSVIRRLLVPCTERMETVSVHETSHGPCKESVNDVSQVSIT